MGLRPYWLGMCLRVYGVEVGTRAREHPRTTNNIGKVEPVPTGGMGTASSPQVVHIACKFCVRSIAVRP